MSSKLLIILLTLFAVSEVYSQGITTGIKSYRAVGELISLSNDALNDTNTQILFEENYDSVGQRASLTVTIIDIEFTIVEYEKLKQMFVYEKVSKQCRTFSPTDFEESSLAPIHIKKFIIKDGNTIFPVRQLLALHNGTGTSKGIISTGYREIPAQTWGFKLQDGPDINIEIDAYWSIDDYTSPSKNKQVPLGYHLKRTKVNEKPHFTSVNLFLFTHDEFDEKVFEPARGVHCPGRQEPDMKFPDVSLIETLTYKSEYVWEDYKTFSAIDAWIDPKTKLFRFDMIPSKTFNINPKDVSRIISKNQGVVYEISEGTNEGCVVDPISETQFDPQTIIDYRQDHDWSIKSLFGSSSASDYIGVGKTSERGIPCLLYHGIRKDWPTEAEGITTLWEWCISNDKSIELEFPKNRYPIVSLNIYVMNSTQTESTGVFYEGLRFTHHFHNAKTLSSKFMDAAYFDIRDCFDVRNIRDLSFTVDVSGETLKTLKEQDRNPEFVGGWKYAVNEAAKLLISSMRVSGLRVTVTDNVMRVNFGLLGRHPKLLKDSTEPTLDESFNELKTVIDSGNLKLNFTLDDMKGKKVDLILVAKPGSLVSRTRIDDYDAPLTYSPGVMAAVAIIMLMLGVAVGAGGVFTRYTYFKT